MGEWFFAPKGLYDLAWGFNPRITQPRRRALKRCQRTRSFLQNSLVNVRAKPTHEHSYGRSSQSILRPFRARCGWAGFPGLKPHSANSMRLLIGDWLLSRRDSAIVARHEVPGNRHPKQPSRRVRSDLAGVRTSIG
jgi:hypothetical protein